MTLKYAEPAIYELLSGLAGGRVYALRAPENSVEPFIIFQQVDSERWRSLKAPSGIAQATFQIDAYAAEFYASKDLAASIEEILDGHRGIVYYGSDSPQDSVDIAGISLQGDTDLLDQTDLPLLFRNSASYLVTYRQ